MAPNIDARASRRPDPGSRLRKLRALLIATLQSPHELARPAETRSRLIATLFGRASSVLMVALAALICGSAAVLRSGHWLGGVIVAFEVCLLLARCGVILAFQRRERSGTLVDPDGWLVGFGLLAIGSSAAWGALCFVCLAFSHDPVLYVMPVLSTVGTAGAVAARNSGAPRLVKLQLAASLLPIVVGSAFPEDHGYRLLMLLTPAMAAGLLILVSERNRQLVELIETQAELARLSQTDPLTELPNRRFLDARLEAAATDAAGSGRPYALLMIDVDSFKAFNDRNGHPAGDALLRHLSDLLRDVVRGHRDVVARYGGEEFAVLLDGADEAQAVFVGERLRQAVQAYGRIEPDGDVVTISVGVATVGVMTTADIVREADEALYRAKRGGRNRVEVAVRVDCKVDRQAAA